MKRTWAGDQRHVWDEYMRKFERRSLVGQSSDHYEPLNTALMVSLDFLDGRILTTGEDVCRPMSYKEMHRALCILRKQTWIPVGVLLELWDLTDEAHAEGVVNDMAGVGVVYAEHQELPDGPSMLGLRLHDLVLDFAREEAKKRDEERKWPAALLDAYRPARDWSVEQPFGSKSVCVCS